MPKTISYLLSDYPTISHTFFLTEITHLRRKGLDINVISINDCDRPDNQLTQSESNEKAQTFYLKSSGLRTILVSHLSGLLSSPLKYFSALFYAMSLAQGPRTLLYRLFYFAEAIVVAQRMTRTDSSHLHIHFGSEVATVGLIAKKFAPITLSLTIHGSDEFYDVSEFHLTEKITAADFIFCISAYTASQLMRLSDYKHWRKMIVAPLGVDTNKFKAVEKSSGKEAVNILCVGRLTPAKGQHLLIHAIADLKTQFPQTTLTLVGDGEDRDSLTQLAEQLNIKAQINFVGSVNQNQIVKYYNKADIFCLPSFAEGVPVVLMEAMAMEIPCVTTRITGIPELIRHKKDGFLVGAGDSTSLKNGLATLIASPELRVSLGNSARLRVIEKYHLQTNFDSLAQQFELQLNRLSSTDPKTNSEETWSLQS